MCVFQKNLSNDLRCYECVLRKRGQCKATVKLGVNDNFLEQLNDHTHPSSQTNIEVHKQKANIKKKVITTNDTCQQILGAELQNISATAAAAVNLPALKDIRRNIRKHRFDNNIPPIPLRRQDIPVIPQLYQLTNGDARFLLFDSGAGDGNRTLIFSTQEAIQLLARNKHWFMDGAFKLCPQIFYQIYTIHALNNNTFFPVFLRCYQTKQKTSTLVY